MKQLTVQSVIQALSKREETVKEALITHDKLKVLVHDLILVELWRENILARLAKGNQLTQSFTIYPILYHESTCINLLETVLYHPASVETLGDAIIDLTDYCLRLMNSFITSGNSDDDDDEPLQNNDGSGDYLTKAAASATKDIDMGKMASTVVFANCFKALSTIRYIIENLDSLGSGLISRFTISSDAPMLLTQLLLQKPWRRENWQTGNITEYDPTTATWKSVDPSSRFLLGPTEIQAWLALYMLLKNNHILGNYELYESRKNQLLRLRPNLHELSLDQLPILGELQLFLNQLAVQSGGLFTPSKSPLLLEMIAPIRDQLEKEFKDDRKTLIKVYSKELLENSREILMEKAQKLAVSYSIDTFEHTLPSRGTCATCGAEAEKRCSKCKQIWYCTRDCQAAHWKIHKANCGNEK